eukprot:m.96206 g.96206  ORF g.96206 m.96206 type:complete len:543 (+) comp13068_c0_seq1:83-1711(+)
MATQTTSKAEMPSIKARALGACLYQLVFQAALVKLTKAKKVITSHEILKCIQDTPALLSCLDTVDSKVSWRKKKEEQTARTWTAGEVTQHLGRKTASPFILTTSSAAGRNLFTSWILVSRRGSVSLNKRRFRVLLGEIPTEASGTAEAVESTDASTAATKGEDAEAKADPVATETQKPSADGAEVKTEATVAAAETETAEEEAQAEAAVSSEEADGEEADEAKQEAPKTPKRGTPSQELESETKSIALWLRQFLEEIMGGRKRISVRAFVDRVNTLIEGVSTQFYSTRNKPQQWHRLLITHPPFLGTPEGGESSADESSGSDMDDADDIVQETARAVEKAAEEAEKAEKAAAPPKKKVAKRTSDAASTTTPTPKRYTKKPKRVSAATVIQPESLADWSASRVADLLPASLAKKFRTIFEANGISGAAILSLEQAEAQALGLPLWMYSLFIVPLRATHAKTDGMGMESYLGLDFDEWTQAHLRQWLADIGLGAGLETILVQLEEPLIPALQALTEEELEATSLTSVEAQLLRRLVKNLEEQAE